MEYCMWSEYAKNMLGKKYFPALGKWKEEGMSST